ncbi:MAG: sensor histidine kinase, partial [Micromonosporaceae bacterium]
RLPSLSSWHAPEFPAPPTPALADGLVIAFMVCLGMIGTGRVLFLSRTATDAALGTGYVLALVAIQVAFTRRLGREFRPRGAWLLLLVQALLVYLPLLQFSWWLGLPGLLAGTALLALRPAFSVPFFAIVVLSFGWVHSDLGGPRVRVVLNEASPIFAGVYGALTTVMIGLAVYGLTRLVGLAGQVYTARDELARLVVAEERLRFAHQLQELLAVRLSAVIARAERIKARFDGGLAQVREGLADILAVSRRALADVRSVARGYQRVSLANELSAARSVLTAAGVEVRIVRAGQVWSGPVGAMLASALREGATNVLRYSHAQHCDITVRETDGMAQLEIVNDGVPYEASSDLPEEDDGSLSRRLAELGGELDSGAQPGGRYLLRVTLPIESEAAGAGAPESAVTGPRDLLPRISQRLAIGTLGGVLVCFGLIALGDILIEHPDPVQLAIGSVVFAAIVGLQLGYFGRPGARLRPATSVPLLLVQAILVYGVALLFGEWWLRGLPGFVAASVLLVLRPAIAVPAAIAITASEAWLRALYGGNAYEIVGDVITTATTVVLVYGLTLLTRLVSEFHQAQSRLARMAVAEERLRFARDLHDLLGLSMSAISLKAGLAAKLLEPDPAAAQEQVSEIVTLSRKALGDVRSVASGYLELSLDEELRLAHSVLTSADIAAQIERNDRELPEEIGSVLATVVREGTTNVLRHSNAEWCEITVRQTGDQARLEIVNNGVPAEAATPGPAGGNGIRNLSHRVGALGGECFAGIERDGIYRLRAAIPLPVG